MVKIKNKRTGAATLVESIIALVIITAISGITLMLFSSVITTGISLQSLNAEAEIEKTISAEETFGDYSDGSYWYGDLFIKKEFFPFPGNEKIVYMRVSVSNLSGTLLKCQNVLFQAK